MIFWMALITWPESVRADELALKLASLSSGGHKYFHKLLEESLKANGHNIKIEIEPDLPQPRIVNYIENNRLTLHWFLQTKERDSKFVLVNHKLTQGLIGQRIFLIPKGDENVYAKVKNLDDFKALKKTAGLGSGWFDVSVWKENDLPVIEQPGEWKLLYKMVASKNRGVDFFPRGANEIVAEAKDNPDLAIEPKLILAYDRDFVFYLSKENEKLKPILEAALDKAEKSGLQAQLIKEFYYPLVSSLALDKRTKILLKNPTAN